MTDSPDLSAAIETDLPCMYCDLTPAECKESLESTAHRRRPSGCCCYCCHEDPVAHIAPELREAVKAGAAAVKKATRFIAGDGYPSICVLGPVDSAECVLTAAHEACYIMIPWTCPDCAFTFDADHTDVATGEHSCPACAELRLEAEVERLRAELAEDRRVAGGK